MKDNIDDIFLLQRIKDDDEPAFKYLFKMYFTPVYRFIFLYIKDSSAVEEIALDVFTTFWEKRKNIEIKLSLKAYLFQTARNRTLNYIRDNVNYETIGIDTITGLFEEDHSLEVRELENLIEEAICSLPEKCQEVFRKSRIENLTNKEIAGELDITTKTVEAQITKALKTIRSYLGKKYSYLW